MHDIGWAPNSECCADGEGGREQSRLSFEIWGGIKAREVLLEWGAPRGCADEVCEAIIRHTVRAFIHPSMCDLTVRYTVQESSGDIGAVTLITGLLQLGPSHDFRAILHPSYIDLGTTANIHERYPRLGLIYHFKDTLEKEMERKPGCMTRMWAPVTLAKVGGIGDLEGAQGRKGEGSEEKGNLGWLALK